MSYATTPQTDVTRCLVCGGRETPEALFVAVLTPTRGKHHWLHTDCHELHVAKCAAERRARAGEMLL